jgi:myosin-5
VGASNEDKRQIWEDGLFGVSTSDFAYLRNTSAESVNVLASSENWKETVDALLVFGIQGLAFLNVMRLLCVILQLGNITFDSEIQDRAKRLLILSVNDLNKLSSLMGVSSSKINASLTKRFMNTRGEEFTIFLKPNEARDRCNALAKEIYARVFDLLVTKCNKATEPPAAGGSGKSRPTDSEEYGTISLLDIFGFECFTVNCFKQLCIIYANECLQKKYVVDTFQSIQHEYEAKGVNVFAALAECWRKERHECMEGKGIGKQGFIQNRE